MTTLTISSGGKSALMRGFPVTVEVDKPADVAKVADVKAALATKIPALYVERQKLTLKGDSKALDDDAVLAVAGVLDGGEVAVKDLGPQVSWRTVFMVEYAGPLVIHPLFYHLPKVFYRGPVQHSQLQKYVYAMVILHFVKREVESVFVHRFSHATMPLRNIFKNSAHYHILSGLFLAYPIYGPTYSVNSPFIRGTMRSNPQFLWALAGVWLYAELSNLKTHLITRSLRPAGSTKRSVPHGYGFNLVSFPNYFFESLAWAAVAYMSGSWSAWFFWTVSTAQMLSWAAKKHRAYKKEFGKEFPRGRKAMIPFLF
ncbi:3-oxo-5-alpha-steroid 4-dehydrogenase-domain-containing protein [Gloeopeniophorella convolvens]|nr:3-oxo-5-alpha-steroid 4-dehydrogenase-domain-containing protein [Gloeopeniophorella convolvens]